MIRSGGSFDTHFEIEFPGDQLLTDVYTGNIYEEWGVAYNAGEKHVKDFDIVQVTVVKQRFPIRIEQGFKTLDKAPNKQG